MRAVLSAARAPPADFAAALRSPLCYSHPVNHVEVIETHISWVFLAGAFAYKVKKPVDLGFLDFSTLEQRRRYCEEEVRLNRRTAPGIYLGVVPIAGPASAPVVDGEGEPIEFAVKMRRFAQSLRLDERARSGTLAARHVDALAACVARFHAQAGRGDGERPRIAMPLVLEPAMQNFETLARLGSAPPMQARLEALREWTRREHEALAGVFARRRIEGFVRECHGDLHLANIVLVGNQPVPFDCIEFDPSLRWIDVMNDVAFVVMDLHRHALPRSAARFLNAYLEHSGDYAGLAVLRFYVVYRALVRAKIAALRARQPKAGEAARDEITALVQLATRLAARPEPALTIMQGLSGSGKTTVSQRLLESGGAIRVRSDVERKRMHGLDAAASGRSAPGAGPYTAAERERVYERLAQLARSILAAGYPVIVDAAFLERTQRERFRALAQAARAAFAIAACSAPEAVLREHILRREREGGDASDAGLAVLEHQLAMQEPLAGDELGLRLPIDTSKEE